MTAHDDLEPGLASYLAERARWVDAALERWLPPELRSVTMPESVR